jgi:hypothetical protein
MYVTYVQHVIYFHMTQLHFAHINALMLFHFHYLRYSELLSEDDVVEKPVSPYAATKKSW